VDAIHWLVVGERTSEKNESREFEARMWSIAQQPLLAGCVHFLGPRTDVARLMNECDLLVHAARQEPLGRVLLEAAASGLTVVATDVGGTREIFPHDTGSAVLVPADNVGELCRAIVRVLQNEARRRMLGDAARRRAQEAFDVRLAAARLIDQYQQALAERGCCRA
jgi:glycosyltransferase involved in cell wall biosynthesis